MEDRRIFITKEELEKLLTRPAVDWKRVLFWAVVGFVITFGFGRVMVWLGQ